MRIKNMKPILLILLLPCFVMAENQALDDQEILNVESIYKNQPPAAKPKQATVTSESVSSEKSEAESDQPAEIKPSVQNQKVQSLTDLNKLAPFREVSIIQKKFLPKTERFQLFAAGGTTTNSPWFLNLGLKVNLGYYFTESFGVELSGIFLTNTEREVAKEIRDNNQLQPEKFINTKNYYGIDLVWAPIYGKLTMLNSRIIPFDMYFSAGGGTSSTNSLEGSVPTLHVGMGQIFAISKSMAFRWDYSLNTFQATPIPDSSLTTAGVGEKNNYNDLILTAGLSFFFPEAKYR